MNNFKLFKKKDNTGKEPLSIERFFKMPVTYIIMALMVVIIACITFYAMEISTGDKIAEGVSINGTNFSRLSKDEALAEIRRAPKLSDKEITITSGGQKTSFSGGDIGLKTDVEDTLELIYKQGRGKNVFSDIVRRVQLYFKPESFRYVYSVDKPSLEKIIYDFGVLVNGELKNYNIEYGDGYIDVSNGEKGQSKDVSKAYEQVKVALDEEKYDGIEVTLEKSEPSEPSLDSLYDETYLEPQDAKYEITDGTVIMTAEVVGRQIDKIEAGTQLERLRNGETVRLKLIAVMPKVTLAELNAKLFNHTLAQYSTMYSVSDKNRSANLTLAAAKINGIILAPGSIFSYNDAVGPRTAENGFKEAPIYENGETVQGMGGGVCQISSTLYSAVLYADLQVVQRRNHSMTVGYVPKGQDATVSYGSIDFRFKNNTGYPIKIVASAVGGKATVAIVGTAPDVRRTVKITGKVISSTEPTVEEIQSNDLLTGKKQVVSKGKTGYVVETIRIVYENGTEVKSENIGRSVYKMVPTKVLVGAKVPEPLAPLPPRETPTPVPTDVPEPTPANITPDESTE